MSDDAAPGQLVVVQELVNSFDARRGRDELVDAREATTWLRTRGLLGRPHALTGGDVERLQELRVVLRRMCLANNGAERRAADADFLNAVVRDAGIRPTFTPQGADLRVNSSACIGALGRIVALVYDAVRDGMWSRLKACPEDACNYTFYDTSRNGSRVWCSMAGCGTKVKMRAYRARVNAARPAAPTTS